MSWPYTRLSLLGPQYKKRELFLSGYVPKFNLPIYGMNPRHISGKMMLKVKLTKAVILEAKSNRDERWGIRPMSLPPGTHYVPITLYRGRPHIMIFQLTFEDCRIGFGFRSRKPASEQPSAYDIKETDMWLIV
jgi:hypothetical protein